MNNLFELSAVVMVVVVGSLGYAGKPDSPGGQTSPTLEAARQALALRRHRAMARFRAQRAEALRQSEQVRKARRKEVFDTLAGAILGASAMEIPRAFDRMAAAGISINERPGGSRFLGLSPLMYAAYDATIRGDGGPVVTMMVGEAALRLLDENLDPRLRANFEIDFSQTTDAGETLLCLLARGQNLKAINLLLATVQPAEINWLRRTPDFSGRIPYDYYPLPDLKPRGLRKLGSLMEASDLDEHKE